MFQTQKKYEEDITVFNEGSTVYASGGIGKITNGDSQTIKALIMPETNVYRETRKEGRFNVEIVFAHVRKTEMDKVDMLPGKTRITWNGNDYRVMNIIDYRAKPRFKNAEIEMRRTLGVE